MESRTAPTKLEAKQDDLKKSILPDPEEVISDWFSQEYPDRLKHECWWRDNSQYREYHKTL
jgi:hypothetical protein